MTARILLTAVALLCARPVAAQSRFTFFEPVTPPRTVQIIAHGGLQSLAPENSAEAVQSCAFDFIEWASVEVRRTRDGQHVILRDDTLDRTTSGKGPVDQVSLDEFVNLDAGTWFARRFQGHGPLSLAQMLEASKGRVNLWLNCTNFDPAGLVKEILAAEMQTQVVVAADPTLLAKIRTIAGKQIATAARFDPNTMDRAKFVTDVDPAVVEIDADQLTAETVANFRAAGIKVQARLLGAELDRPAHWTKALESGADWLLTEHPTEMRFIEVRRRIPHFPVQFACHRGASRYAPENTLPAIQMAVALGANYVEVDIRTTKDGQFVLVHDGSLDRTTNGKGRVSETNHAVIAALDAGAWFSRNFSNLRVPSLDEGLIALGDKTGAYLDAKDISPENLYAAMRKHRLIERSVVYQSPAYLAQLRALDPAVRTMPPLKSAADFATVAATKPYAVDASWQALSRELIDKCHQAGIRVFSDALGLNEHVERYQQAMDWGIDVIQTDHPLRVLRAIELYRTSR